MQNLKFAFYTLFSARAHQIVNQIFSLRPVFMISEEDKSSDVAKEYWFRVLDLDDDGELRRHELEWFFREQQQRMQHLAHESILFDDIFCQLCVNENIVCVFVCVCAWRPTPRMHISSTADPLMLVYSCTTWRRLDMVKPAREDVITLADLRRCKLTPFFFNMLFNLNKFIRHEQRDALAVEREKAYPHLSYVSIFWEKTELSIYCMRLYVNSTCSDSNLCAEYVNHFAFFVCVYWFF